MNQCNWWCAHTYRHLRALNLPYIMRVFGLWECLCAWVRACVCVRVHDSHARVLEIHAEVLKREGSWWVTRESRVLGIAVQQTLAPDSFITHVYRHTQMLRYNWSYTGRYLGAHLSARSAPLLWRTWRWAEDGSGSTTRRADCETPGLLRDRTQIWQLHREVPGAFRHVTYSWVAMLAGRVSGQQWQSVDQMNAFRPLNTHTHREIEREWERGRDREIGFT